MGVKDAHTWDRRRRQVVCADGDCKARGGGGGSWIEPGSAETEMGDSARKGISSTLC